MVEGMSDEERRKLSNLSNDELNKAILKLKGEEDRLKDKYSGYQLMFERNALRMRQTALAKLLK